MNKNINFFKRILSTLLFLIVLLLPIISYADENKTTEEYLEEAEQRKSMPVQTNEVEGWPDGPLVGAEAAILMDAETGEVLYAKNINAQLYPASTTKLMACVVAMEHTSLDDLITVSQSAIDANDWDGSNMALVAGEQLTVDELLHGILITSANEACNAIAEFVCGNIDDYVTLMNEKATELGCTNTHFISANGLHDPNHYTSAYDMALIGREFFKYDVLCHLSSIAYYEMPETELHQMHCLYSKNKLFEGRSYYYPYLVGSKTGYTGDSRQCLVSCAEKDGTRLICVIFKEESPYQFDDTVNLFEYGFNNFTSVNIAENETAYEIGHTDFFDSGDEIFGNSAAIISMDKNATLKLPNGTDFSALTSSVSYENVEAPYFAYVNYYYNGYYVGRAGIMFSGDSVDEQVSFSSTIPGYENATNNEDSSSNSETGGHVMVNIVKVIFRIIVIFILVVIAIIAYPFIKRFIQRRKEMTRGRRRSDSPSKKRRSARRRNASRRLSSSATEIHRAKTNNNNRRANPSSRRSSSNGTKPKVRHDIKFDDFNLK